MRLIILLALLAVAAAAPQLRIKRQSFFGGGVGALAQLLRFDSINDGSGNYRYSYEQSDGQKQQVQGQLQKTRSGTDAVAVKGSYSWMGPDGVTYDVNYTADENGYQPDIEQGPGGGIPPAVIASLTG